MDARVSIPAFNIVGVIVMLAFWLLLIIGLIDLSRLMFVVADKSEYKEIEKKKKAKGRRRR